MSKSSFAVIDGLKKKSVEYYDIVVMMNFTIQAPNRQNPVPRVSNGCVQVYCRFVKPRPVPCKCAMAT